MDFFSQFKAGADSCVKNLSSQNTTDFTYYLSYIFENKNFVSFFITLQDIHYSLLD